MRKKIFCGAGILLGIVLIVILAYFYANPIVLKEGIFTKELKAEYKEKFNAKEHIRWVVFGSGDDVKICGKVNSNKIGLYDIEIKVANRKQHFKVRVNDTKAPTLTVKDYTTDKVEKITANSFSPKVTDAAPTEKIKLSVSKEKPLKKQGKYEVVITAKDPSGNKVKKKAKLTRVDDKTPPTLKIGPALNGVVGADFSEENLLSGISAQDNLDRSPKVDVDLSQLDVNTLGTYKVIYTARDRSGNIASGSRDVIITQTIGENQKVIYLTFDDGPSFNTEKILNVMAKYKVKGTFFVTGNDAAYRHLIKRAANEGHTVALHTYTHNYNIYTNEDAFFTDLTNVGNLVKELTGIESHHIRFAGGSSNTISRSYNQGIMSRLVSLVQNKGFKYYDWNVSSGDASGNTVPKDKILSNSTSSRANHICLLMHDSRSKTTTADALPGIIEHYQALGYTFLPISDSTPVFHHGVNN